MKSITIKLLLLVFILGAQTVYAQKGQRGNRAEQQLERLKSIVDLTAEQETEINALQEQLQEDMEALKAQEFEDRSAKRQAFKELMTNHKAEVESVLTEEQLATIKSTVQEKRAAKKEAFKNVDWKALKTEIKAYHQENVSPVLLAQRVKLEEKISAEDKVLLAEMRQEAKAKKAAWKAKHAEMKGERGNKRGRKGKGRKGKKHHAENDEFRSTMKSLVEKYDTEIEALNAEIEPQKEKWAADLKAIHQKYMPEMEEGEEMHRGRKHKGHKRGYGKDDVKLMKKGHFLLMDPNADVAEVENLMDAEKALVDISVFPNPATDQNTITYTVQEAGQIVIELRTESGVLVQTVVNEFLEKGTYQEQINVSGLKDGVYYYSINDQKGITTEKVIISNNK